MKKYNQLTVKLLTAPAGKKESPANRMQCYGRTIRGAEAYAAKSWGVKRNQVQCVFCGA